MPVFERKFVTDRLLEIVDQVKDRRGKGIRLAELQAMVAESDQALFDSIRQVVMEVVGTSTDIDISGVTVVPADARGGVAVYPKGTIEIKVMVSFASDVQKAAATWFDVRQNQLFFQAQLSRRIGADLSNLHPSHSEAIPDGNGGDYQLLRSFAFEVLFNS